MDEFAASGNPNGPGIAGWPRFDPQNPSTLHFNDGIHVGAVPDMATLEFWTAFDRQFEGPPRHNPPRDQPLINTNSLQGLTGMPKIARIE